MAAVCTEVMPAQESSHAQHVLSSLNQQRALGQFCDAMLNVGGGVVYLAHRNVLACFSELFQDCNMPAIPCTEVCLQECPYDGLELLLNFVYTGELKLDAVNLEKVQRAASSLCVPEALTLCQRFMESSREEAVPVKRKRGRPKKSTSDASSDCSVKEEASVAVTKDEPSFDTATAVATTAVTTTTRSGRRVKGPRRLVGESPTTEVTLTEKDSKKTQLAPVEEEGCDAVVESQSPLQPTEEIEVEYVIHINGENKKPLFTLLQCKRLGICHNL